MIRHRTNMWYAVGMRTNFLLKSSVFVLLAGLAFVGVSCSRADADRGVLRSTDSGRTWEQKSTFDGNKSIAGQEILEIEVSPFDNNRVFVGTAESGLLISVNKGESWSRTVIGDGVAILTVAFSDTTEGVVYAGGQAGTTGKIYKSIDGGTNWIEVFSAAQPNQRVTSLVVDWYDDTVVYAGLYDGTLLKSKDEGVSWAINHRFPSPVQDMAQSTRDSRSMFVATSTSGMWYTRTGGERVASLADQAVGDPEDGIFWANINLEDGFAGTDRVFSLWVHPKAESLMYAGTRFGLLRSMDEGLTWEWVPILAESNSYRDLFVVTDPLSQRKIYVTDGSSFYVSNDFGVTWTPQRITSQRIRSFTIDPQDPQTLYIGVQEIE